MSDIICVTNRLLCREDFLIRIEKIARANTAGIVLREKDLSESEYKALARQVMTICQKHNTKCILHTFANAAVELNCSAVHLPLPILRKISSRQKSNFEIIGASCHSSQDAIEAQKLGCTYITAGHIFDTECKKGLPGRGLDFLENICKCVSIPVYAIGGISPDNIAKVRAAGAKGACVMGTAMLCENPQEYFERFTEESK